MSRQKTLNQATHTQVKNTKRKHVTALKKRKMKNTCQSKILIRISTGKWVLATMKMKKAVGRNRRAKKETDVRTAVVADLEKGTVTIVTATNPSTRQILMKGKGVEGETEAEVQRSPKTKKNLSTDEQGRGGSRRLAGLLLPDLEHSQTLSEFLLAQLTLHLHASVLAFRLTLMVWGTGRVGRFLCVLFIQILLLCIHGSVHI